MDNFEEYVCAVLICGMVIFEAINAFLGLVGAASHGFPQEIAIDFYVWLAFMSVAFCAKKGCDVAVTMLSDKYKPSTQRVLRIVCTCINLFLSVCLLIGGFGLVSKTAAAGTVGKLTGIPMVAVHVSAIIGYALCTIRNAQVMLKALKPTET